MLMLLNTIEIAPVDSDRHAAEVRSHLGVYCILGISLQVSAVRSNVNKSNPLDTNRTVYMEQPTYFKPTCSYIPRYVYSEA